MNPQNQFNHALKLLQTGKLEQAERICRLLIKQAPANGPATHLLGLVRKSAGDHAGAEKYMRQSLQFDPRVAEYYSNLANLLRSLGRNDEAAEAYGEALQIDPMSKPARIGLARSLVDLRQLDAANAEARELTRKLPLDPESWSVLAMVLREQGRLGDAERAYRKSIAIAPGYAAAHHNLGSVLSRMDRAEEALESLNRAESLGVAGYELQFNLGRTLLQLYRFEDAERAFAAAVQHRPLDTDAQINLARVRFMQNDPDFARNIFESAAESGDDRMRMLLGLMLRRSGDLDGAAALFRDMLAGNERNAAVQSALAEVLHEMGRPGDARDEVLKAVKQDPDDPIIIENAVAILLACGRADEAMPYIRQQRAKSPFGQGWIAYETTAARLLGQDLYADLCDYDRLVKSYEIEPADGRFSIEQLNAALLRSLNARHQFPTHPLDQSLRNGSQTARSMLTDPDPAIQAVISAFAAPIEQYRRSLGTDPDHPVSVRNTGATKITGAWSVQLRKDGFHVNHFHPEGWISSAYYVAVPDEINDMDKKSGWLKFGEPRFPVPGATPEKYVRPKAGRLVLFPSYLWHGTNPILGNEPRTTIAFDVLPT